MSVNINDNSLKLIKVDNYIVTTCKLDNKVIFEPKYYELPVAASGSKSNDYYITENFTSRGSILESTNGPGYLDISSDWRGDYYVKSTKVTTGAEFVIDQGVLRPESAAIQFKFICNNKTLVNINTRQNDIGISYTLINGESKTMTLSWPENYISPHIYLKLQQELNNDDNKVYVKIILEIYTYENIINSIVLGNLDTDLSGIALECTISTATHAADLAEGGNIEVLRFYVIDQYPLTT